MHTPVMLQEAVDFLQRELDRRDLPVSAREERLYALIDHGGLDKALPYIRALAEARVSQWAGVYEEGLRQLGHTQELVDFWQRSAVRS